MLLLMNFMPIATSKYLPSISGRTYGHSVGHSLSQPNIWQRYLSTVSHQGAEGQGSEPYQLAEVGLVRILNVGLMRGLDPWCLVSPNVSRM